MDSEVLRAVPKLACENKDSEVPRTVPKLVCEHKESEVPLQYFSYHVKIWIVKFFVQYLS